MAVLRWQCSDDRAPMAMLRWPSSDGRFPDGRVPDGRALDGHAADGHAPMAVIRWLWTREPRFEGRDRMAVRLTAMLLIVVISMAVLR